MCLFLRNYNKNARNEKEYARFLTDRLRLQRKDKFDRNSVKLHAQSNEAAIHFALFLTLLLEGVEVVGHAKP